MDVVGDERFFSDRTGQILYAPYFFVRCAVVIPRASRALGCQGRFLRASPAAGVALPAALPNALAAAFAAIAVAALKPIM